jgi:hypothetical protein
MMRATSLIAILIWAIAVSCKSTCDQQSVSAKRSALQTVLARVEIPYFPVTADFVLRAQDISGASAPAEVSDHENATLLLDATNRLALMRHRTDRSDLQFMRLVDHTGWLTAEIIVLLEWLEQGLDVNAALLRSAIRCISLGKVGGVRLMSSSVKHPQVLRHDAGFIVLVPADAQYATDISNMSESLRLLSEHVAVAEARGGSGAFGGQFLDAAGVMKSVHSPAGRWPLDGCTRAGNYEFLHSGDLVEVIKKGMRAPDKWLRLWSSAALLRRGRLSDIVGCEMDADGLHYYFPEVDDSEARMAAFEGALKDPGVQRQKTVDLLRDSDPVPESLCEMAFGYWVATTGDSLALPLSSGSEESERGAYLSAYAVLELLAGRNGQALLEWLERFGMAEPDRLVGLHLHGHLSTVQADRLIAHWKQGRCVMAAVWLAESGHPMGIDALFGPVESGCYAAIFCMRGDLLETAWRSGQMPRLLAAALRHGGYMLDAARFWLKNDSVLDLSHVEFASELARLLGSGCITSQFSAVADAWMLRSR